MDFYEPTAQDWEQDLRDLRRRLMGALLFMVAVTLVGTLGFRLIDPSSGWVRAFFMTAITLTTVGYGHEVALDSNGALIFTAMLILVGMGGVLYFVSTATAFVLEGQLGHVFRRRQMEKELAQLDRHLIVCGAGQTAVYTAKELLAVRRQVVMVVEHAEEAKHVRLDLPTTPIVVGDPAQDDILIRAGVERAAGIVACTDSDKENLVVTLTARQLNADIRIVTRAVDVGGEAKLRKVGADAVVSPNFIGGLRLASELIRPTVVDFLDTMLRDRDANLRIDEVRIPEGSPSLGRRLDDLGLDDVADALLLAVREADGTWQYNPPGTREVTADLVLVFLGSPEDSRVLCNRVEGVMISPPSSPA